MIESCRVLQGSDLSAPLLDVRSRRFQDRVFAGVRYVVGDEYFRSSWPNKTFATPLLEHTDKTTMNPVRSQLFVQCVSEKQDSPSPFSYDIKVFRAVARPELADYIPYDMGEEFWQTSHHRFNSARGKLEYETKVEAPDEYNDIWRTLGYITIPHPNWYTVSNAVALMDSIVNIALNY